MGRCVESQIICDLESSVHAKAKIWTGQMYEKARAVTCQGAELEASPEELRTEAA